MGTEDIQLAKQRPQYTRIPIVVPVAVKIGYIEVPCSEDELKKKCDGSLYVPTCNMDGSNNVDALKQIYQNMNTVLGRENNFPDSSPESGGCVTMQRSPEVSPQGPTQRENDLNHLGDLLLQALQHAQQKKLNDEIQQMQDRFNDKMVQQQILKQTDLIPTQNGRQSGPTASPNESPTEKSHGFTDSFSHSNQHFLAVQPREQVDIQVNRTQAAQENISYQEHLILQQVKSSHFSVGKALKEIRENKLYHQLDQCVSFKQYVENNRKHFGFGYKQALRLIEFYQFVSKIPEGVEKPKGERQVRDIFKLGNRGVDVWLAAVEYKQRNNLDCISSKLIGQIKQQMVAIV